MAVQHLIFSLPIGLPPAKLGPSPRHSAFFPVYFRALVNFTRSIEYTPQLEDANTKEFREVSDAVVEKVRGRELPGVGGSPGVAGSPGVCGRHLMVVCPYSWSQST